METMQEHQRDHREFRLLGVIADTSKWTEKTAQFLTSLTFVFHTGEFLEPIEKKLADPFLKLVFLPASVTVKAARKHLNKLETHLPHVLR